jgi:hypothetical protein
MTLVDFWGTEQADHGSYDRAQHYPPLPADKQA